MIEFTLQVHTTKCTVTKWVWVFVTWPYSECEGTWIWATVFIWLGRSLLARLPVLVAKIKDRQCFVYFHCSLQL